MDLSKLNRKLLNDKKTRMLPYLKMWTVNENLQIKLQKIK